MGHMFPPNKDHDSMFLLFMFAALLTATASVANDTLPTPRIVGGTPATAGEFPFFVHGADGFLCGGTLIAPDIVLTAAHCIEAFGNFVIIGAINVYGRDRTPRIDVESLNQHPDYVPGPEDNDIMLLKLADTASAPLVNLNFDPNLPAPGTPVTAVGFGFTKENGNISEPLLQVEVAVVDMETCLDQVPGVVDENFHLCAGVPQGGKDSCDGDSGGPLLDSSTQTQYGVVTFGRGCARPNTPGVYTRVSYYESWIKSFVCENSVDPPYDCGNLGPETMSPTAAPTSQPTETPVASPTGAPFSAPTTSPIQSVTKPPTAAPTAAATIAPTGSSSVDGNQTSSMAPSRVNGTSLKPTIDQDDGETPTTVPNPSPPSLVRASQSWPLLATTVATSLLFARGFL